MKAPKKAEIERENQQLREALEEIYDHVAELLGLEDDDEGAERDA
jgi:hypothetical protein